MCSSFRSTKLAPILSLSLVLSKYLILPNFFPLPPLFLFLFLSIAVYCTAVSKRNGKDMFKHLVISNVTSASYATITIKAFVLFCFCFGFFFVFFFKTEIVPIRSLHIDQLHYQILMPCRLEWVKSKIFTGYFIDLLVYQ